MIIHAYHSVDQRFLMEFRFGKIKEKKLLLYGRVLTRVSPYYIVSLTLTMEIIAHVISSIPASVLPAIHRFFSNCNDIIIMIMIILKKKVYNNDSKHRALTFWRYRRCIIAARSQGPRKCLLNCLADVCWTAVTAVVVRSPADTRAQHVQHLVKILSSWRVWRFWLHFVFSLPWHGARVSYTFRAMACDFQRCVVTAGRRNAVCPDTPRTMPEHALLTNYSYFVFPSFRTLLDTRSKFHTLIVSEITSSTRVH